MTSQTLTWSRAIAEDLRGRAPAGNGEVTLDVDGWRLSVRPVKGGDGFQWRVQDLKPPAQMFMKGIRGGRDEACDAAAIALERLIPDPATAMRAAG